MESRDVFGKIILRVRLNRHEAASSYRLCAVLAAGQLLADRPGRACCAYRAAKACRRTRRSNFADRAARRIGPWIGRHRVALDNLRKAYPEKTEAEIEAIASDMWGNMARLAAEYIFLDQLFDL